MKHYYQDEYVTIYHGDCRDITPKLNGFDLVLTDPPYVHRFLGGAGSAFGRKFYKSKALIETSNFDLSLYKDMLLNAAPMLVAFCSRDLIVDYAVMARDAKRNFDLRVWHKTNAIPFTKNTWKSDIEYTALVWSKKPGWKQFHQSVHSKVYTSPTCKDKHFHPTVKPIPLLSKYIKVLDAQNILDPFAGSGSTGVAAKGLGRKCVLIEKEEKYCEIAANRCAQGVLGL